MNFKTKNANDLISKDKNVSKAAAKAVIESGDIETFKILSEKSDFIFDFIKEKIIQNLTNAVNSENLENLFCFTKIYNREFGEFIIKSFVKFANEDLTDKMLEIFEGGTPDEMAYSAQYFYHINDPLALEYLNKFAFFDFEPLAENCALALRKFNDRELYNRAIEAVQDKEVDDFEKYKYINFLVSYGDKNAVPRLLGCLKNSFTKGFIASSVLYLTSFFELVNGGKENDAVKLFDIILSGYPEEISLETVIDFNVFEFVKYLENKAENDSYIKRMLLKAKNKFNLISDGDIYTFDLSKEAKNEINKINNFLNNIRNDLISGLQKEFESDDKERVLEAFDVVLNYGLNDFAPNIADIIKTTGHEDIISEGIKVLRALGQIGLVNKEIADKISNENLKIITLSYFE